MPPHYRVGLHQDEVRAPVRAEAPQQDPEDPVPRLEPGPLDASPEDRKLLAEGQILQRQPGPSKELTDLVQIGLREYAGQVPETLSRQGG